MCAGYSRRPGSGLLKGSGGASQGNVISDRSSISALSRTASGLIVQRPPDFPLVF